jgi:uncharacterized protein DUF4397
MAATKWGGRALTAAGLVVGLLGSTASIAQGEPPQHDQLFLVQATPGAHVEVSLDGSVVARDVPAKDIIGPLRISPGNHVVRFDSGTWVVTASFTIAKPSTDVVLHRSAFAKPKPVVTVFDNDVTPVAPGKGRLVIAHTAVVPPADVRVDGQVLFSNIANGEFIGAVVPAKTYSADIVPTGQDDPLFGPVDVSVKAAALTRVFAIGQPTNGGMDAIVQVLPLRSSGSAQPQHVNTGSAGLVATPSEAGGRDGGLGLLLIGLIGGPLLIVILRRRIVR